MPYTPLLTRVHMPFALRHYATPDVAAVITECSLSHCHGGISVYRALMIPRRHAIARHAASLFAARCQLQAIDATCRHVERVDKRHCYVLRDAVAEATATLVASGFAKITLRVTRLRHCRLPCHFYATMMLPLSLLLLTAMAAPLRHTPPPLFDAACQLSCHDAASYAMLLRLCALTLPACCHY